MRANYSLFLLINFPLISESGNQKFTESQNLGTARKKLIKNYQKKSSLNLPSSKLYGIVGGKIPDFFGNKHYYTRSKLDWTYLWLMLIAIKGNDTIACLLTVFLCVFFSFFDKTSFNPFWRKLKNFFLPYFIIWLL